MGIIGKITRALGRGYTIATDWLLIVMGGLLVLIALRAIDVDSAKYAVLACGVVITGVGLRFRSSRLQRKEK